MRGATAVSASPLSSTTLVLMRVGVMEGRAATRRSPGIPVATAELEEVGRLSWLGCMYGADFELPYVRSPVSLARNGFSEGPLGKELLSTSILLSCMHQSRTRLCFRISRWPYPPACDSGNLYLRQPVSHLEGAGAVGDTPVSAHRTYSPQLWPQR
ncbi:uncharacterized protein LY79DRAFT_551186 [Colletotrichum navitas]|uniref:Uncharacterized protein n=1 Tax=Colletotrichum navitas TaxID=681940 RepID=A0AAD8V4E5_9PEZI|nr:uncharacterized protein LY79DRAFT_551186 [Colletotrichum navitas]KAK1593882.1 hypothetical protein LY79DRAFT_551186 [Colletotrichum navitas]